MHSQGTHFQVNSSGIPGSRYNSAIFDTYGCIKLGSRTNQIHYMVRHVPWRLLVPWGTRRSKSGPSDVQPLLYVYNIPSSPNQVQEITEHGWQNWVLGKVWKHAKVWVSSVSMAVSHGKTSFVLKGAQQICRYFIGRWREHNSGNCNRKWDVHLV